MFRVFHQIRPRPPFRLDLTVWALRRVPANVIDRWDGHTYRRALAWPGGVAEMAVFQTEPADRPLLVVTLTGPGERPPGDLVTQWVEKLLGTNTDLSSFYRMAEENEPLGELAARFRGMKPPRFPTVFETIINGIACQQISLAAGIHILSRLTLAYGQAVDGGGEAAVHAFPCPQELAGCTPEELRAIGFSRQKAHAAIDLASRESAGMELDKTLEGLNDDEAVRYLTGLRGVGRWTAEYVLLRGLGRLHVFPGDDVGMRKRLGEWLGISGPVDYQGTRAALAAWSPFAGLVYLHLLLRGLEAAGHLK